jgi:phosphohistidine phosphatase
VAVEEIKPVVAVIKASQWRTKMPRMDLILWRHADAVNGESLDDFARPLTSKGRKRAASMATWLDRHLPESARVLVSPAKRAVETAEALAEHRGRKIHADARLSPGADPALLLAAAGWPDSRHPVVIVGHQPALGRLTSLLLFGAEHHFSIKKAGIVWLTNRGRSAFAEHHDAHMPDAARDAHDLREMHDEREERGPYPVALRAMMCPDFL